MTQLYSTSKKYRKPNNIKFNIHYMSLYSILSKKFISSSQELDVRQSLCLRGLSETNKKDGVYTAGTGTGFLATGKPPLPFS